MDTRNEKPALHPFLDVAKKASTSLDFSPLQIKSVKREAQHAHSI